MVLLLGRPSSGLDSSYIGGVRGQIIDPLDILFANPQQKDEQKQEWIAIRSREEVEFIKQIADKPDEIRPDNAGHALHRQSRARRQ